MATDSHDHSGDPPPPKLWSTWLGNYDALMLLLGIAASISTFVFGAAVGLKDWPSGSVSGLAGALVALAIAGGALATGAAAGFLFGLPRTLTSNELRGVRNNWQDFGGTLSGAAQTAPVTGAPVAGSPQPLPAVPPAAPQNGRIAYTEPNSNLEQISDWLTKIIVGVGLTQLYNIPPQLDAFGQNTAKIFGAGGFAFGIGGGLFFLIYGFFLAYVGTRVRLSHVFTSAQVLNDLSAERKLPNDDSVPRLGIVELTAPRSTRDQAIGERPNAAAQITDVSSPEQLIAFADMQFRDNKPVIAVAAYSEAIAKLPFDPTLYAKLAAALAASGKTAEANSAVATIRTIGTTSEADAATKAVTISDLRARMEAGLYQRSSLTPRDTIEAANDLFKLDPRQEADVWVQVWLACAHAQETEKPKAQAEHKALAVAAIKRAIAIDPTIKDYLATLYDPAKVRGEDDDLTPLYGDKSGPGDEEVNKLLGLQPNG